MKKLAYLLIAISLDACQSKPMKQQGQITVEKPAATLDWGASLDTLKLPPSLPVWQGNVVRRDLKSVPVTEQVEIERFFQQHKLMAILQTITGGKEAYALNGFRGSDKYRTEVAVLQAHQDAHNPAAYRLAGLSRTKRKITPFKGQVIFETLSHEPMLTAEDQRNIRSYSMVIPVFYPGHEPVARYAVGGKVTLWEKAKPAEWQRFTGTLVMEVALTKAGEMRLNSPFLHGPSRGGALKYEGAWAATKSHPAQPAVWVEDIVGYSPNIFEDLMMGERDAAVNPKYAKLGWNEYWENDEWWADSPKPSL